MNKMNENNAKIQEVSEEEFSSVEGGVGGWVGILVLYGACKLWLKYAH